MPSSRRQAGIDVVKSVFGASLYEQGRGFYVTLELLAILWGTRASGGGVLSSNEDEPISFPRRSHDFARRWMAGAADSIDAAKRVKVVGDTAPETLQALLGSLRVPIPHRRKLPKWGGQHLYPYVGELIHYDAVERRNRVIIERYTYRGAGGLAHKALRIDPDQERLSANRIGLELLVTDSGGRLGQLAKALFSHDDEYDESFLDDVEYQADLEGSTVWLEHLRNGVRNIVTRSELVRAKQIEHLMYWVPFCIARHQLDLASRCVGRPSLVFPASFAGATSGIRARGRRDVEVARWAIEHALLERAADLARTADPAAATYFDALRTESQNWRKGPAAFFTGTLAAVGALNAHTGARYFTVALPLLEALTAASLPPGTQSEFDDFCWNVLFNAFGMVADRRSASAAELTCDIDAVDFESNARSLADDLRSLGMLSEYSDATRMVHAEVN